MPSYLVNAQRALERHIYPVGAWQASDPALVSVALFFGGYSGTRLLEPVAGVVVERVVDFVRRIGGRPAN